MRNKTCCFTGHRVIEKDNFKAIRMQTEECIKGLIAEGVLNFICGGAIGFDMLCGELIIEYKKNNPDISLTLALPCQNQDKYFSWDDKKKYIFILANADYIIYTSDNYFRGCMHKRNRYMVDNSAYLIAYCKKNNGGSFYTRNYAIKQGVTIIDIMRD